MPEALHLINSNLKQKFLNWKIPTYSKIESNQFKPRLQRQARNTCRSLQKITSCDRTSRKVFKLASWCHRDQKNVFFVKDLVVIYDQWSLGCFSHNIKVRIFFVNLILSSGFNNFNLLIVIIGSICQAVPKENDVF